MEDDRRLYSTGQVLAANQAAVGAHFGRMVQHVVGIQGWLLDGREIVLEWLEAAARTTFQTPTIAMLWQPINEGAHQLNGRCPRGNEAAFLADMRQAAVTLRWLRVSIETHVSEDFPPRVLAAIAALDLIDRTLATFRAGQHDEAERMFLQIDLSFLKERASSTGDAPPPNNQE